MTELRSDSDISLITPLIFPRGSSVSKYRNTGKAAHIKSATHVGSSK